MMNDVLTKEGIKYMIARLMERANEAVSYNTDTGELVQVQPKRGKND